MLKKFFLATVVLAAIIGTQFISGAKVSAKDVWVYTDGYGVKYYVITETFQQEGIRNRDVQLSVDVKCVHRNSLIAVKNYSFEGHTITYYRIDGVFQEAIYDEKTFEPKQPAYSIFEYVRDNLLQRDDE